jgi:hypothetical protein
VDVNLSNDDDTVTVPKPDASVSQKALASDDTREDGASLAEPSTPNPISSGVPTTPNHWRTRPQAPTSRY